MSQRDISNNNKNIVISVYDIKHEKDNFDKLEKNLENFSELKQ